MGWLSTAIKDWRRIKVIYSFSQNEVPGRSWSRIITRCPRLEGSKLYVPQSGWIDAGYIDLKERKIVMSEDITVLGQARLKQLFDELCQRAENQ